MVTYSDMLNSETCKQRSLAMEIEVGDDGTAGPLRLGYYKLFFFFSNIYQQSCMVHKRQKEEDTTNTKLYSERYTPQLHPHKTGAHSLRTGAKHRCACVFLVIKFTS